MWNDVETTQDFLNFTVIADTVSELIRESCGEPISIGVSGNWGAGKSSLIKMIGKSLKNDEKEGKYIFLDFNAWLYQGYDDAKNALLKSVAEKLNAEADKNSPVAGKIKSFCKRINIFQVAKLATPLLLGLTPFGAMSGIISNLINSGSTFFNNTDESKKLANSKDLTSNIENTSQELKDVLVDNATKSVPQEISKLREEFESILNDLNVTLVVLVDDLDRCLPDTAISTLEAMRLLLFVKHTAFIIAADEEMIRNGVKSHFKNVDMTEGMVNSYFDKLIQVPITVPRLGIAEVKIYTLLLFCELTVKEKKISSDDYQKIKENLLSLLKNAWQEDITEKKILKSFTETNLTPMKPYIAICEEIAFILATAEDINGNPRLIKRFLNALVIRNKIARLNGMSINYDSLVKMMLFERCSTASSFEFLTKECNKSQDGKVEFISNIEQRISLGENYEELLPDSWKDKDFINTWLKLSPKLGDTDLRPLLYLSRDKSLKIVAFDELSKEASEVLASLAGLTNKTIDQSLVEKIKNIGEKEAEKVLIRMIRRGNENQWTSQILVNTMHITEAFSNLGSRLSDALSNIPEKSLKADIIPKLKDKVWAKPLLDKWYQSNETTPQVKNAINSKKNKENN